MLTVRIVNISGLAPESDYAYDVYVNDMPITSGILRGHMRDDGWAILVKKIAEQHIVTTTIERDDRVIGMQQVTLRELPAKRTTR
jgi:hypothetical protein